MIRVSVSRCFFALIKANKPTTSNKLTAQQIDACRQVLAMTPCHQTDLNLKAAAYLQERSTLSSLTINAPAIYSSWQHSNPLQSEIAVLALSQTMSSQQDKYLRRVIEQWADFIFQENEKLKGKKGSLAERENFRLVLVEFFEALNSLCYLLVMDEPMVNTYMRIYDLARGWKVEDKSYSHLRFVLDQLLKLDKIPQNNLQFMVSFTSKYPLQSVYHQKEKDIIGLIYRSLPPLGRQKRNHHQLLVNLLHNMTILTEVSASMKSLALNIYHNFSNSYLRLKAFCTLIDIFIIDSTNINKYLPAIRVFLTQQPNFAFKQLPLLFYRAGIWLPQFWQAYFNYISTADNYKILDNYHHFVIDDLLAECGTGGKSLQQAARKFRQVLQQKGIEIQKFDLRKEYERSFGRIKDNKSSCQMHVANSMRLICSSQVLTEVSLKYFIVDVLIDQRVVVEINNSQHYKTVEGQQFLNLKSQFRQRVLESNGYKYYNIKVDDLTTSNYSMLQDIYAIVDSTRTLKQP